MLGMTLLTLPNIKDKILIVGSIYDKTDKISKIRDMIPNYYATIFNGNLLYPFNNPNELKERIGIINELIETQKVIYNLGNYDLKLLNILHQNEDHIDIQKWILSKPNVIAIDFANSSSILVMSGGLTPDINSRMKMWDNLELSFVSQINNKPWQVYYGGTLGYVISNNPATPDKPRYFPYAAQIGTRYSKSSTVYAQEIDQFGLKNIIEL